MSFVYVVSDGIKTKVGMSGNPAKRTMVVAYTVFSRNASGLRTLVLPSPVARRAEEVMKSILSSECESAGGVHPTETFFIGFDDACAIARWSVIIAGNEATASLIGHRKKSIGMISARCKRINARVAMIRNDTKLSLLARKINASQKSMYKAVSGERLSGRGVIIMANAADALGMKVSELVELGEDKA